MTQEWEWRVEGGEIEQCDSCFHEAPLSKFEDYRGERWLCELCSSTMISNRPTAHGALSFEAVLASVANFMLNRLLPDRADGLRRAEDEAQRQMDEA